MKPLIILILSLLLPLAFHAEEAPMAFRHYSIDQGLPSNCVRDITQDSKGFIWFATDDGLVRFDGRQFRTFNPHEAVESAAENDFVSSVIEAGGRLWIGGDNGVYYYDPELERIISPRLVYPSPSHRPLNGSVRHLTVDLDGKLWVAAPQSGVYRIDPNTLEAVHYDLSELSNQIGTVFVDSRNDVWVASNHTTGSLMKLDKSDNTFRKVAVTHERKPFKLRSTALAEDPSGNIWVGLWQDGLAKLDPFSGEVDIVLLPGVQTGLLHIHSLLFTDKGLLIGSDSGLTHYFPETGKYHLYVPDELNSSSLSNQFVYPIKSDREGGIWIGTFFGGVNYVAPDLRMFHSSQASKFYNSVSGNVIGAFCEDRRGNVWIASDDGGLSRYEPSTGLYKKVNTLPGQAIDENIQALCLDGDDLWIGTYGNGVKIIDTTTGKVKRHFLPDPDREGSLDDLSSYTIFKDIRDNIWVATMQSLMLYDRAAGTFESERQLGSLIVDIKQDASGRLWFATQGHGLFTFHPYNRVWKNYRVAADHKPNQIPHNHVNSIDIDSKGRVWLATSGGLAQYRPETDDFELINLNIPKEEVYWVVEDQNILWATSDDGLVRHDIASGQNDLYTTADGLPCNQFVVNSGIKTSNGRIWIGSMKGLASFTPFQIKRNTYKPTIAFTGLDVVNKPVDVDGKRWKKTLKSGDEVALSHDDYLVSFSFASLSFANPDNNQYMYKLEGFDKDWIHAGNDNRATYTNLPAGNYTLLVRASNNDNQWSDSELSLRVRVLPPWYASKWMLSLYVLALLAVVIIIVKFNSGRNEKRHRKELSLVSSNKEKEVYQAKLSFFTMIAHEIRTPVSLIMGPIEKLTRSSQNLPAGMRDDLSIIDRNGQRLLFLINQLLDFRKVDQSGMDISFQCQNISRLIKNVAERFKPSIEQLGGTLTVDYPPADFEADVDGEALTKLMSNLLNNARKFMTAKVVLSCSVMPGGQNFEIAVSDDGRGIKKDDQDKIFKPFVQIADHKEASPVGTGLSLSIVKSVVEGHHGSIRVESAPGKGAKFIVTLPVDQPDAAPCKESPAEAPSAKAPDTSSPIMESDDKRPTLLIVDDNDEMLQFIKSNFEGKYQVELAFNGREALDRLASKHVDLIVSDWMMPELDGPGLCRAVRDSQTLNHIPFIMLTAKTDNDSKIEGFNCGADAYVEKPFSIGILEAQIDNLLEMRRRLLEKFSTNPLEPISSIASNQADDKFLTDLTALIEENFSNPKLSVDLLASTIGMSRSGLYAKIKSLTDSTPNELIQITRLKRAAQLLAEGRYRVNEVSFMVGFNSSSYFSKCFQKQFGVTPSEFQSSQTSGTKA